MRSLIFVSLYTKCFFSLAAVKMFSLSLMLRNLIVMCLGVTCFIFLVLGVCWVPWISQFIIFIKFGKLWAIISSNIFLFPLVSFSPSVTPIIFRLCHLNFPTTHWCSVHFFKFSFLCVFHFESFLLLCIQFTSLFFFAVSHLPLIPSNVFFTSHVVVFTSVSLIWVFKRYLPWLYLTFWTSGIQLQ